MQFKCLELSTRKFLGTCTLPGGVIDPVGTEHMFGNEVFILVETTDNTMFFEKKEA